MKAFLLSDGEFDTKQFQSLHALVERVLADKGFSLTEKRLRPRELKCCMGCFGCWVKTPGECVIKDAMADINRETVQSDVVIYLVPVVFGQYSANMKNAIDRWIPNILPFFRTKPNGDTTHPARYASNPQYVMIGYADDLTEADKQLFWDITNGHRENGEVLFYEDDDDAMAAALAAIDMQKTGDRL